MILNRQHWPKSKQILQNKIGKINMVKISQMAIGGSLELPKYNFEDQVCCRAISRQRRFSQSCDDPLLPWIFSSPLLSLTLSVLKMINWRSGAQNLIRGIYHVNLKVMMRRALRWLKPEGLMFVQVDTLKGCV